MSNLIPEDIFEAKKPPDRILEMLGVYSLLSFQEIPAYFYFSILSSDRSKEILMSFIEKAPPFLIQTKKQSIEHFKWFLHCLIGSLHIYKLPFLQKDLISLIDYDAIHIMKLNDHTHQIFQTLKYYLGENKKRKIQLLDKNDKNFLLFVNFAKENPPLFEAIKPLILSLNYFSKSNIEFLIKKFNIYSFPLLDYETINNIDISNVIKKMPEEIFNLKHCYIKECSDFAKNYQILQTSFNAFPKLPEFAQGNVEISIINTSIISQKHFMDLIYKTSSKLIVNNEIEKAKNIIWQFPDYGKWILSVIIEKKSSNANIVQRINEIIEGVNEDSICMNFIRRMANDRVYLDHFQCITGSIFNFKLFEQQSIPFVFKNLLTSNGYEPFSILTNRHFYFIDDQQLSDDLSFICSYVILTSLIETKSAEIVTQMLLNITNEKVKESLVIDAFSLLFLKDKDQYVFSVSTAFELISALTTFVTDPSFSIILKNALNKTQMLQLINGGSSQQLDGLFVPFDRMILNAISKGHVEIAQRQATEIHQKLISIAQIVNEYRTNPNVNDMLNILNENEDLLKIQSIQEIVLSINDSKELFESLQGSSSLELNSEIKQLFEKETFYEHNTDLYKLEDLNQISSQLTNLNQNKWTMVNVNTKPNIFAVFVNYLNCLIPFQLEKQPNQTVGQILNINLHQTIIDLLKNQKIEEVTVILKTIHKSIEGYVLEEPSIDRSIISEVFTAYPVVKIADDISLHQYEMDNSIISKYLKLKENNKNDFDGVNQNVEVDVLVEEMNKRLNETPIDFDVLVDFSYRIPSDMFISILEKHIQSLDISILYKYSQSFGCDYLFIEKVVFLYNVHQVLSINPFPLKTAFQKILEGHHIDLAKKFINYYRYDIDVKSLIRKEILNRVKSNSQSIYEYLTIMPSIRSEIIESIPSRYHSKIEEQMNKSINAKNIYPENWSIKSTDPIQIINDNFSDFLNVIKILTTNVNINYDNQFQKDLLVLIGTVKITEFDETLFKLKESKKIVHKFNKVFRSVEKVIQPTIKHILALTQSIQINNENEEYRYCKLMKYIHLYLLECISLFQSNKVKKTAFSISLTEILNHINCLNDLINLHLNARFGCQYSFEDFHSKTSVENFIELLMNFDRIDLASCFQTVFLVNDSIIREKYAIKCFLLGKFERGITIAPNRRRSTSMTSAMQSEEMSHKVIQIFAHPFIFENELIAYLSESLNIEPLLWEFTENGQPPPEDFTKHGLNHSLSTGIDQSNHRSAEINHSLSANIDKIKDLNEIETSNINSIQFIDFNDKSNEIEIDIPKPNIDRRPIRSSLQFNTAPRQLTSPIRQNSPTRQSKVSFAAIHNSPPIHLANMNTKIPTIKPNVNFSLPHFYRRIVLISNMEISFSQSVETMKMLRYYLRNNAKIGDQVTYYVSCGNFEKAFKYMSKYVTTDQSRWTLFFNNIFIMGYSYSYGARMKYRIIANDPYLDFFGSYLEKLLRFAIKTKMPHLQLELEIFLERFETAAETAIRLSAETKNITESSNFLNRALKSLNSKKKLKKVPQNNYTPEQLANVKEKIELQVLFYDFCLKKGLNTISMNIFQGQSIAESMVVFLFKENNFELAIRILSHCNLRLSEIAVKVVDNLINDPGIQPINLFIAKLRSVAEQFVFETILNAMLRRLFFTFNQQKLVFDVISMSIDDPTFKCKLLIQFMQIEEAYKIAKTYQLLDLFPLLANLAFKQNFIDILNDVNKILLRQSK